MAKSETLPQSNYISFAGDKTERKTPTKEAGTEDSGSKCLPEHHQERNPSIRYLQVSDIR